MLRLPSSRSLNSIVAVKVLVMEAMSTPVLES